MLTFKIKIELCCFDEKPSICCLTGYSFVFSENLESIMLVLAKLDKSNVPQTRHDESVVLMQCKTKEEVMTLEENLAKDIYMQSLVCSQGI